MMTSREVIEVFLRYEIAQGQDAYEMLMDGYDGDTDAYIEDYIGDYEVSFDGEGAIVTRTGYDEHWRVTDGTVERFIYGL